MFNNYQRYCCLTFLYLTSSKVSRLFCSHVHIVALLSWGFYVFSIDTLSAQNNDPRAELTELLFKAVKNNDINAARAAIKAGAELSRINLNGETAMDIAINNNHFKIANYLVFARRIEQQVTNKLTPPINSIQQTSPEAAPVVEILADSSPVSPHRKERNIFLPSKVKLEKPHTPKQSAIKNIKVKVNKLDSQDKNITKTSQLKSSMSEPKSSNTNLNIGKGGSNKPEENTVEKKLNSSKTIFFMDADGNLVASSATEIRRIQKTLRQKASRLLPDIEPRKSLFVPKPRLKPSFLPPVTLHKTRTKPKRHPKLKKKISPINQTRLEPELSNNSLSDFKALSGSQKVKDGAMKLSNVNPENPKPELSANDTSHGKKLSKPQSVINKTAEIDYIRPTRRISPELLNKLRRGLEETKRQQKMSRGRTKNPVVQQINSTKVNKKKQKKQVETNPLPAPNSSRKEESSVAPKLLLEDKTRIDRSKPEEKNIFGRIFTNLTNFLGVTSSSQKSKKKKEFPINQVQTSRLLQQPQSSEANTIKIQTGDPRARNRSKTKLSIPLKRAEYEKTSLRSQNLEKMTASNNRWSNQIIATPHKSVKRQLNKKEIAQRELTIFDRVEADANLDKEVKGTKYAKTKNTINNIPIQQPPVSMPLIRLRNPLQNISLALGNSITTGQSKLPHGIAEPDPCIQKRRGEISFCIVPIDWPQEIESAFVINTSLYQGTRAIARYDRGKATHFHVLFKSAGHNKIINFIKHRYGPPSGKWKRTISPFGKPRQPNPTFIWRSHDINKNEVTILEVRKFDDTRTVFPDTKHGAIRLYFAGGPPVFPIVTAHDIMSIDWAARSDHLEDGFPALAKTIRVQP